MCEILKVQKEVEADLMRLYGPLMTGEKLWRSLGYISKDAFRQSILRETVPIALIDIPNRRGKFALTKDVSLFLVKIRYGSSTDSQQKVDSEK